MRVSWTLIDLQFKVKEKYIGGVLQKKILNLTENAEY